MRLKLGPLLRYVDETRATVWVETTSAGEVEVLGHRVPTWSVHGHHYALVLIEGLQPASATPYEVHLNGVKAWPLEDSPYGPSVIHTPRADGTFRLAFGSCRRSGPDALVALAEQMAAGDAERPDALLLLGDQVYADEIGSFEEYTWLYDDAWLDPAVRWLFSTVPLCMLLEERVSGAYPSYWVYQHLGNLSPEQLEKDPTYAAMRGLDDEDERSSYLDAFAWEADEDPVSTRWSYYRDFGARSRGVRLLALDSRCSRQLQPDERAMIDAHEWEWIRRHTVGATQPINHLLLASTLPFLLGSRLGEKIRQGMELEQWASFRRSFDDLTDLLGELVQAENPPSSVLMLSGDAHSGSLTEATLTAVEHPGTAIRQLTMSPFRSPVGWHIRLAGKLLDSGWMTKVLHGLSRSAGVRDVAASWRTAYGPWFENGVMTVTVDGDEAAIDVDHARWVDGRQTLTSTLRYQAAPEGVRATRRR